MELIEKAICECYTGYVFCTGEEREAVYRYLECLEKKPIFTHRIMEVIEKHQDEIKEDFKDVCTGEYESKENSGLKEKCKQLENQNEQLKNAAFNVCAEYKGCEGCPLHDAKECKCKLLDSYPEPKEAIHEYIQRIYRR